MKSVTKIVLVIFILFLATPTIVFVIDKDIDTSYFFNTSEEEESHRGCIKIKSIPAFFSIPLIISYKGFQKIDFSVLNDKKVNPFKSKGFLQPLKF
jgi:hypothetical protein